MLLKLTYYAQLCSKNYDGKFLIACINSIRNRKRATSASATIDVYYIYGPVPRSLISEGLHGISHSKSKGCNHVSLHAHVGNT